MKQFSRIVALSALFFGGLASASASSLLLLSPNLSDLVAGVGNIPSTTSAFTENYISWVYADPNNVICANCLDFVYVFANNGPGDIEHISVSNFGSYTTDVGVSTSALNVSPADFTQSGGTITFDFTGANDLFSGETTSLLVIETNALNFQAGTVTISDPSASVTVAGFQPIPEPASLTLLGTGLLGAVGVIRRRFAA